MRKGAEFSPCGKYRFALWRLWDDNLPTAMCIGLNPSTANSDDDDPTINSLIIMLKKAGYGGFYMMNLFSYITSKPVELQAHPQPDFGNDTWLLDTIPALCDDVIFCWGNFTIAEYKAKRIAKHFPSALCFGRTKNGKPLHPLAAMVWKRSIAKLQPYIA